MNKARRIEEYERLGFTIEEAEREAAYDAYLARRDVRARLWLKRQWQRTAVGPFVREQWPQLLWAIFWCALLAVANRSWQLGWLMLTVVVIFEFRLFRGQRGLRNAVANLKRERDRLKRHNRTLAGAVESAAEFIVEQRMEFEGHPLGPVVWIDGQAYPVDDEQSVAYDNDKE